MRRKRGQTSHVVQSVCQLYDDDSIVFCHGKKHFSEVLRLLLLDVFELKFVKLRNSLDEIKHFVAEIFLYVIIGCGSVLDDVVQKRGHYGGFVEAQIDENFRHGARVNYIRFSGFSELPVVHFSA